MEYKSKVAVITGAGSGIGRSTALKFLENDYIVIIAGRNFENLEKTKELSKKNNNKCLIVQTDIKCLESVKKLFKTVKENYGRLDFLFNNAGIGAPAVSLEDINYEDWKSVVDTNLTGAFLCIQQAFIIMKTQDPKGGRIINNGSISAYVPRPLSIAYTATKHAITGLTKSTSLDGRKYNIVCGQIDIGNAETKMTNKIQKGILQANGNIMSEPTIDVENVAEAILYMDSLPLNANVQFITIMASKMPYIGRG